MKVHAFLCMDSGRLALAFAMAVLIVLRGNDEVRPLLPEHDKFSVLL